MADIQEPVAENLHARLATTGITKKLNASSSVSVRTAVRDQRGILRGGSFGEEDLTTFTAFLPRRACECAIACARAAKKSGGTRRSVAGDSTGVGKVPLPAVEVSSKKTVPAGGWRFTSPLLLPNVPLPAVEASEKETLPPLLKSPLPAVEFPKKRINVNPPWLKNLPLPAVELS